MSGHASGSARAQRAAQARQDARAPQQARLSTAERERLRLQQERQARLDAAELRRRDLERERLRAQRDGRYYDDRYYDDRNYRRDDRWDDIYGRDRGKNGHGPAFCRSGQGHPVHGRSWCQQKGFGLGRDRWERTRWDDIIFRDGNRRRDSQLGRSVLGDILGSVVLGRFESYGRQYSRDPLVGYWVPDGRTNVLMLSVGDFPIARLIDLNRDGRVDNVYLWR